MCVFGPRNARTRCPARASAGRAVMPALRRKRPGQRRRRGQGFRPRPRAPPRRENHAGDPPRAKAPRLSHAACSCSTRRSAPVSLIYPRLHALLARSGCAHAPAARAASGQRLRGDSAAVFAASTVGATHPQPQGCAPARSPSARRRGRAAGACWRCWWRWRRWAAACRASGASRLHRAQQAPQASHRPATRGRVGSACLVSGLPDMHCSAVNTKP